MRCAGAFFCLGRALGSPVPQYPGNEGDDDNTIDVANVQHWIERSSSLMARLETTDASTEKVATIIIETLDEDDENHDMKVTAHEFASRLRKVAARVHKKIDEAFAREKERREALFTKHDHDRRHGEHLNHGVHA